MPEHIQYQDDELFNPETHHEESDVPIKPLFWAIAIFIVFAIVTHLVLAWMYEGFRKAEKKRMDPPYTQVALPPNAYVPQNQPLLQPFPREGHAPREDTPVTDLVQMRAREEQQLHSYGWADKQKGTVHIPIENAKQLMLKRGFPTATAPAPPVGTPASSPPPPGGAQ